MSGISVAHVWKEYGSQVVLEDVCLEIAERAFVALVGPSGCGKTTFLRMILGQERPTRGRILLDGEPLPAEPGADRGVVYQRYSVFPHMTALGNVMAGPEMRASRIAGRLHGAARRRLAEEARAMIAEVGLAGAEAKYPAQLSGGMQQRLALAQALMMRPRVLLLDEPFGALDALTRAHLQDAVMAIHARLGNTMIMITHDVDEAVLLADRIVMMTNGPAATIGEVLEVPLPRPRDRIALAADPDYLRAREAVLRFLYERHRFVEAAE